MAQARYRQQPPTPHIHAHARGAKVRGVARTRPLQQFHPRDRSRTTRVVLDAREARPELVQFPRERGDQALRKARLPEPHHVLTLGERAAWERIASALGEREVSTARGARVEEWAARPFGHLDAHRAGHARAPQARDQPQRAHPRNAPRAAHVTVRTRARRVRAHANER